MNTEQIVQPYGRLENELLQGDKSLWESLLQIKQAAGSFWRTRRLRWYTDHGIHHSQSVLKIIEDILDPLDKLNPSDQYILKPEELYILITACYLHDIGMQDLRVDGVEGSPNLEQETEIRRTHPDRAARLIRENVIYRGDGNRPKIPLDIDGDFIGPVSLVVRAHGTDYFTDSIHQMNTDHFMPRNKPYRGPFLAALLLMADELDLHEKRVSECLRPENISLERFYSESLLHIYKHHYIRGVEIDGDITNRTITLTFSFPDENPSYAAKIESWVVTKLRQQLRLTRGFFSEEHLRWDSKIRLRRGSAVYSPRLSLPDRALPYLDQEFNKLRLIDREALIDELKGFAKNGVSSPKVVHVKCIDNSDAEAISKWLFATSKCHDLYCDGVEFEPSDTYTIRDLQERTELFLRVNRAGVFVASAVHNLVDKNVAEWLYGEGIEFMTRNTQNPVAVLLFTKDDLPPQRIPVSEYMLGCFGEDDVHEYFKNVLGCRDDECDLLMASLDPGSLPPDSLITKLDLIRKTWVSTV
ncbi:MAG: HD domain-containing protein [Syntrophobacteraceae bacterium]|jgi:hypothetical protein